MDILPQAISICSTAERSLRDLMQSAISAGHYRDLPALARLAEQISQLASKLDQTPTASPDSPPTARLAAPRAGRSPRPARVRQSTQPPRSRKAHYPLFHRDGDTLVKTGWSKSARKEYQHRAPKRAALALLRTIAAIEGKNPIFTIDALLPLRDAADHTEFPGYQVYLALAWLRKEGIVRQHGREGYSLLVKNDLQTLVEQRWTALAAHHD